MKTDEAAQILEQAWKEISSLAEKGPVSDWLEDRGLVKAIHDSVNSNTKSYRYVLPTQILAKVTDHSLDCRCLQASRGGRGAFDARTIAHKVVVPFDQVNQSVLGGSQEPYVNNPLRVPEISEKHRKAQKDPKGWDRLCKILDAVEGKQSRSFTLPVFKQILTEIQRRLSLVRVSYPIPKRISLKRTMELMEKFVSHPSGGDRLLALASSLFVVIGRRFGLYSEVRRGKITSADQPSGMLADLECVSKNGDIMFAVEVKDRQLAVSQLKAKMRTVREKRVSEIFFVAQGTSPSEEGEMALLIDREFKSGHNIYLMDLFTLGRVALALSGEYARQEFLKETGNQLDKYHSDISHRREWANLLADV